MELKYILANNIKTKLIKSMAKTGQSVEIATFLHIKTISDGGIKKDLESTTKPCICWQKGLSINSKKNKTTNNLDKTAELFCNKSLVSMTTEGTRVYSI